MSKLRGGILAKYFNLQIRGIYNSHFGFKRQTFFSTSEITGRRNKKGSAMDPEGGIFGGKVDRFNGVTVDSADESTDCINFLAKLEKSLDFWSRSNRRGIWFKVHTANADWIPILAQRGFDFHHAKQGFVMMIKWLPADEYLNVPPYAHTMVGVGGLVLNSKNEVLVISEKYAMIPNSWKLPGGYVEPGENLIEAAMREVEEETGVKTKFDSVVCLRHSHKSGFDCSDIYVVISLSPVTNELKCDEREIREVTWMPVQDYLKHPNVHDTNRSFVKKYFEYKEKGIKINHYSAIHQVLKKPYSLYSVELSGLGLS